MNQARAVLDTAGHWILRQQQQQQQQDVAS